MKISRTIVEIVIGILFIITGIYLMIKDNVASILFIMLGGFAILNNKATTVKLKNKFGPKSMMISRLIFVVIIIGIILIVGIDNFIPGK